MANKASCDLLPVCILLCFSFCILFAQGQSSPQKINYQAVVRDATGKLVPEGTRVTVRYIIHNGSATGSPVFNEEGSAVTNQFGLISLPIGSNGNLGTIDWANGEKYLQ